MWGGEVGSWGGGGGVTDVSRDPCWQKPSFSKTGNQQAYREKVKVVADVIFYTHFYCSVANEIFQLHSNVCLDLVTT